MKRAVDILLIIFSAPITVPLLGAVALLSLAWQGSPVFFCQERAGLNCEPFRMFKFRTMREGDGSDAERLTGFGSWLRKYSLDELPELWNVLKGDMSLVGPRPLPTRYLPRYTAEQNRRHQVRPGLTGLAQVNGRNSLDWETKFRYDVSYVENHSLLLDFRIMAKTALQVVFAKDIAHAGETTMSEFTGDKI